MTIKQIVNRLDALYDRADRAANQSDKTLGELWRIKEEIEDLMGELEESND